MLLTKIVLLGRENVGKSSLFNSLIGSNVAIVSEFPGFTRDRNYGVVNFSEKIFIFIDTGSLLKSKSDLDKLVRFQTVSAITESNIIFFVVDANEGITSKDILINRKIKKYKKKTYLIVNKIDLCRRSRKVSLKEIFCRLGYKSVFFVSSMHKIGIKKIFRNLISSDFSLKSSSSVNRKVKEIKTKKVIKLSVVGRKNVGKSTLVNFLLKKKQIIECDFPGSTRDSIETQFTYKNKQYSLIDNAGIEKIMRKDMLERSILNRSLCSIKKSNIVILLIESSGVLNKDLYIINILKQSKCSIIIAINKWDKITSKEKPIVKKFFLKRLSFISFSKIHFISSLYGYGIDKLFKSLNDIYDCIIDSKIKTSSVTKIMKETERKYFFNVFKRRNIKMKYAHLGKKNPITVIIHGKNLSLLGNNYKKLLEKVYTKKLGSFLKPIYVKFKDEK
ncbi:hypothetical protein AOQ88_01180 [Candidatus Riesia sp. GBBU]|nr:hypothetical protein AOQ88_01180 [Candidatus Riesia sp. GBBU]